MKNETLRGKGVRTESDRKMEFKVLKKIERVSALNESFMEI
jgi:hypothetical protein